MAEQVGTDLALLEITEDPRPRDKESTLKLTAILERRGWLVPMKTDRHDAKWWRIAIGD